MKLKVEFERINNQLVKCEIRCINGENCPTTYIFKSRVGYPALCGCILEIGFGRTEGDYVDGSECVEMIVPTDVAKEWAETQIKIIKEEVIKWRMSKVKIPEDYEVNI